MRGLRMYGKRFQLWSRIGVYFAVVVLVGVTLFGSIAPASPTLERSKLQIERDSRIIPGCYYGIQLQQDRLKQQYKKAFQLSR